MTLPAAQLEQFTFNLDELIFKRLDNFNSFFVVLYIFFQISCLLTNRLELIYHVGCLVDIFFDLRFQQGLRFDVRFCSFRVWILQYLDWFRIGFAIYRKRDSIISRFDQRRISVGSAGSGDRPFVTQVDPIRIERFIANKDFC